VSLPLLGAANLDRLKPNGDPCPQAVRNISSALHTLSIRSSLSHSPPFSATRSCPKIFTAAACIDAPSIDRIGNVAQSSCGS
jgi:hypothetical protein